VHAFEASILMRVVGDLIAIFPQFLPTTAGSAALQESPLSLAVSFSVLSLRAAIVEGLGSLPPRLLSQVTDSASSELSFGDAPATLGEWVGGEPFFFCDICIATSEEDAPGRGEDPETMSLPAAPLGVVADAVSPTFKRLTLLRAELTEVTEAELAELDQQEIFSPPRFFCLTQSLFLQQLANKIIERLCQPLMQSLIDPESVEDVQTVVLAVFESCPNFASQVFC
jgi:hypothetical protein